jgi:hypothetical protein
MIDRERIIDEQSQFEILGCEWGYDDVTEFASHIANLVRKEEVEPLQDRAEEYSEVLRSLACYVVPGGYNAPDPISGHEFAAKIKDGIDSYINRICALQDELATLKARIDGGVRVHAFNLAGWEAVQAFDHDELRKEPNATLIFNEPQTQSANCTDSAPDCKP